MIRPSELPDISGLTVAVDTETSGLFVDDGARLSCASVAWYRDNDPTQEIEAYAFPFDQGSANKGESQIGLFEEEEGRVNLPRDEWEALLDWLARQDLLNQNMKFDLHIIRAGTREWPGRCLLDQTVWDTMLASRDLNPLESTSLKPTAARLGLMGGGEQDEEKVIKTWLKAYAKRRKVPYSTIQGRYDLIPWSVIEPYVTKDAVMALKLWAVQLERIEQGEADLRLIQREIEVMKVLYRMEVRGIGFDSARSLEAADILETQARKVAKRLPFEPTLEAAKHYWFKQKGVMPYAVTEKKQEPQLTDEILTRMVKDGVAWAEEFQEFRKFSNAQSMWYRAYPSMIGPDGRLRTSYRQVKVISGRTANERVNLQAIPHDHRLEKLPKKVPPVRSLFRASEGKVLWEVDLAQAELRVAAKYARCDRMLEIIEEGRDAHGETATELFKVEEGDPTWFKYRQVSKRGNFSFIFGVGAKTFKTDLQKQTGIVISMSEAERIVNAWKSLYPEFGWTIRKAQRLADQRGYVKLVSGRKRWFAPHEHTHKAFNQAVQGSLMELGKDWMMETERRFPEVLLLFIHDSLVLEVPEDRPEIPTQVAEIGASLGTQMFKTKMEVDCKPWK